MNGPEKISIQEPLAQNRICPSEVVSSRLARGGSEQIGHTISLAGLRPPISISGLVDAILEVGNRRKALLSQLRSALLSSNDFEALVLARQICGLPA